MAYLIYPKQEIDLVENPLDCQKLNITINHFKNSISIRLMD